jgi:hypothetical protein
MRNALNPAGDVKELYDMSVPSTKRLLTLPVFAALMASCSGNSPAVSPPQSIQQPSALRGGASLVAGLLGSVVRNPNHTKSWMNRDASRASALLYVSNDGTSDVTVYDYNGGKSPTLSGTLTGFLLPTAPCTDKKGNVFVPDAGSAPSPNTATVARHRRKYCRTLVVKQLAARSIRRPVIWP